MQIHVPIIHRCSLPCWLWELGALGIGSGLVDIEGGELHLRKLAALLAELPPVLPWDMGLKATGKLT